MADRPVMLNQFPLCSSIPPRQTFIPVGRGCHPRVFRPVRDTPRTGVCLPRTSVL